ncbi:hypothetical protein PGT21_016780 [Puccinia graminis f. sp. tritici]|uniref:Uncharacterized protein n=1 Tax=Puccinia graminis f. sp. tritici TaxID=56615 RepID=A0A5B0QB17_PUCGR|nr:hypothetical protein PGT21_016780 [Puccinia graminis f. sp. tritici]KAA1128636.1 hypothetical protein PGTUg99_017817 [Puccinia graminis f. sp. tritici]
MPKGQTSAQRSGPFFAAHTRSVSGVVAEFRYATLNANGNSAALRYTNRYERREELEGE